MSTESNPTPNTPSTTSAMNSDTPIEEELDINVDDLNAAADVEDQEQGAGETQEETTGDAGEGAAAEEAPETTQASAADPAEQQRQQELAAAQQAAIDKRNVLMADLKAIREKASKGELDVIDDTPKAINTLLGALAEQQELIEGLQQDRQQRQQSEQASSYWTDWAQKNPHVGDKGKDWFAEEYRESLKEYGNPESARVAATERFKSRVKQAKASGESETPLPARAGNNQIRRGPVTRNGARLTPQATLRAPKPRVVSLDDRVERGDYGNIAGIIR